MTIPAPEDRVGTTLADKYVLERLLGVGGSGAVYEARHQRTGARHAIKLLLPSADRADAERMLREARALAKLEHEHIVRLVDLDEDSRGELYLVEELLRGRTLRALLDEELLLSPRRALELLVPILRALGYAHARGIVHRDLKPENIFLCEDDAGRVTPKLLDFGLVREAATSGGTTRPGTLLGTPRYMSPEQAWGRDDIDGRSDLWSLGVVLYECLSGVSPFEAPNDRAVLASIVASDPPHLRSTGVAVDEELADAVMLALTRAPEARVASATAYEAALASVASLAAEPWHAALFRRGPGSVAAPAASERDAVVAPEEPRPIEPSRARLLVPALAAASVVTFAWLALHGEAPASREPGRPAEELNSGVDPSASTGSDSTGHSTDIDSMGIDPTGTHRTDIHRTGPHRADTASTDSTGADPRGADPRGADPSGADSTGAAPTVPPSTGTHPSETAPTGIDPTGIVPTGIDPTGIDTTRTDAVVDDSIRREAAERATTAGDAEAASTRLSQRGTRSTGAGRAADGRAQETEGGARSTGPNAAPLVDEL